MLGEQIRKGGTMARVNGTPGNDTLTGTKWSDGLFGYSGNDTLYGLEGNDYLYGDKGVDRLFAGSGDDRLNFTTYKTDYSSENKALEILDGGTGYDHAFIDVSGSTVDGNATNTLYINSGGTGKFDISIGADIDLESAYIGKTTSVESFTLRPDGPALSFIGNINGTPANLFMTATDRDDQFVGGAENSKVDLAGGDDMVVISAGKDVFTLGSGSDTVHFKEFSASVRDSKITDFNPAEDHIDLSGWSPETLTVTETNGGTMLSGNDDSLFLAGVTGFDPWGTDIA